MEALNIRHWFLLFFVLGSLWVVDASQAKVLGTGGPTAAQLNAPDFDPDVADSEFNHRISGWALIAMAILIAAGYASPRLAFLQSVWPFIFIAAGVFLAVWSDKEIWPRGDLSWTWLIHHDPEARQHKIYSVLLIAMGVIEYLRAQKKLNLFWQRWAFPALAVFGAIFLMFHEHGGGSGLPPGWDKAEKDARIAEMRAKAGLPPLPPAPASQTDSMQGHTMNMDHGAMHHDMANMAGMESTDASQSAAHSGSHAGHVMTPEMLHIQREHLWYTIVGLGIALFKFLSDGKFWKQRWLIYAWPTGMAVLGILLTRYTE